MMMTDDDDDMMMMMRDDDDDDGEEEGFDLVMSVSIGRVMIMMRELIMINDY